MQTIYRYFGHLNLDYSEKAAIEMFLFESQGTGNLELGLFDCTNGYANGKRWMDVTVAMWQEDIAAGLLYLDELYNESSLRPFHWWLDKIFKRG